MGTYQILFHGFGFDVSIDGDSGAIIGFYTARRVKVDNPDEAYLTALDLLKSEEKTKSLIDESVSNGANPRFEAEEIFKISFWSRIFRPCPKGFIFYGDSEEINHTQTESRSKQGGGGQPATRSELK